MEIPPYEESKDVIQRKLDQTTMILQNINAYFLLIDKGFIERIIDREKKQSTIFGGGIAFPHTINQGYAKTILMFGKLEEPYQKGDDWIEFIFLVAIPSEIESKMESELLELYDDIFRIAGEPSLKEALRAVETETEFLSFSKSKGVF